MTGATAAVGSRPALVARQAAAAAQGPWAARSLRDRARIVRAAARGLARDADVLAQACAVASGRAPAEVWGAEVLPAVDALRWLARRGPRVLAPRRLARSRLQWYFSATRHLERREPFGVVGVVSPGNSLVFLALPQVAAALLAGNGVLWKPAPPAAAVAFYLAARLYDAGLPPALLQVVTGGPGAAHAVVEAGVDKLFFTGGERAGLALYRRQARRGRPAVLELSGRHVAIVLAGADPALTARGVTWGKLASGGRNCVAVQQVLVTPTLEGDLLVALRASLAEAAGEVEAPVEERGRLRDVVKDAVDKGARALLGRGEGPTLLAGVRPGMRVVEEEVLGPILAVAAVASEEEAVRWVNRSAARLSASVWGPPGPARRLAERLDVGQVWINDALHPTAQPEVALAGRGASGFGSSRGAPGLLEMAQPKVISETPRAAPRPYQARPAPAAAGLFRATLALAAGGGLRARARAAVALVRTVRALSGGRR